MLNSESKQRLSQLCLRLRGNTPLRKFTPRVGVSAAAWNAWENESGNWGIGNARKLANFIGISVDQLEQYLKGECSLEQELGVPVLNTSEVEMSDQNDVVDQVINWMNSLNLPDLMKLISAGVRLAEFTVNLSLETTNQQPNQLQSSPRLRTSPERKSESQLQEAELALKCWRDLSQGKIPSNPELIKLAAALDVDTVWLKKTVTQLHELQENETNG